MEEIRCIHCGAMNEPDATFCGECGGRITGPGSDTLAAASEGTVLVQAPSVASGGTVLVSAPSATSGGTVLVSALEGAPADAKPFITIAGYRLPFGRPALVMGGAAAALALVLIIGGIWLASRRDPGTSSVYLTGSPTSQVGTTSSSGAPAGAAPAGQPGNQPGAQPGGAGGQPGGQTGTPPASQPAGQTGGGAGTQPASQPASQPATAPNQPAAASNWRVLAQGDTGVNWSAIWPFERNGQTDIFMLTTSGYSATAHFAEWNGSALRVMHTASRTGQAVSITAGDMFNTGSDQAIVNLGSTIWGFDENLEEGAVSNADGMWSSLVIGDFTGSGSQETLVQVPGVGYGLYRIYADQPQEIVGVIRTAQSTLFRQGVVDSAGRRLLAAYSAADQKITNYRWTASGFVAGPSLSLPASPVAGQCFWSYRSGGKQGTVVALPGGVLNLYNFDGSKFSLADTVNVPGGGSWCVASGNFTGTGFELIAMDTTNHGRYVIFGHK